ncbi:MAG: hypothetical protein KIT11_05380 [Fimbriimonadaceae bacterium]|nr:hypothetical protein [Fimbriimonadaceae bacterium]QYK56676.1 MAG: hypothetical protein KF733_04140 [Fimbriimonadaceae bacterium]
MELLAALNADVRLKNPIRMGCWHPDAKNTMVTIDGVERKDVVFADVEAGQALVAEPAAHGRRVAYRLVSGLVALKRCG